jgi:hypothetical protein
MLDPTNPVADLVPQQSGPVYGPPPKPKEPDKPTSIPGYEGWFMGANGKPFKPEGLPATPPKDEKGQESERKAAFLTTNLAANVGLMNRALEVDPSATKPTWGQYFAGFLGDDAKNALLPEQRQVVENSQRLITDAALTLGTGAAYTKEQIEAYRRGFFPQVGDSEAAISAKKQALKAALMAARLNAGTQAPKIDEVINSLGLGETDEIPAIVTKDAGTKEVGAFGDEKVAGPREVEGADKFREAMFAEMSGGRTDPGSINAWIDEYNANNATNFVKPDWTLPDNKRALKAAKKGQEFGIAAIVDPRIKAKVAELEKDTSGAGSAARVGAGDSFFLGLSDEIKGGARALSDSVAGKGALADLYNINVNAERELQDSLASDHPLAYAAGQFGGGLALPGFGTSVARLAKTGAGYGALYGFNSGDGSVDTRAASAVTNAAGGALTGFGIGKLVNRAGGRQVPGALDPRLADAAIAEDVRISQPMIDGNRKAINRAGALEADSTTAAYVQQGLSNTEGDIEARVAKLGIGGIVRDPEAMGETFRQAAKEIQRADRQGATAAYDAARNAQPDAMVDAVEMRAKIDAKLTQLARRPNQNREQISELKRYRADLEKPLPLQEIRDIRTEAYDNISGLNVARSSGQKRADRYMMSIVDSAKKDIEAALKPEALAAWQTADKAFAENQNLYRQALKPILGDDFDKLSGEDIFNRMKSAANKNGRALAGFHRRLTAEQSRDFAATIAESMGRRSTDEPFSADMFVQQARRYSPSARETIFGPSGAASFDNLLLLSRRLKMARSEINRSKTARPVMETIKQKAGMMMTALLGYSGAAMTGSATGLGAGVVAGVGMMGVSAIRKGLSAKALMNPRLTRWMAQSVEASTPKDVAEAADRLRLVIDREPALVVEMEPVYELLTRSLEMPLAADPNAQRDGDDE